MELLALAGVLFVIASISFTAVGNVTEASRREKLQSDVFALNRAVQVYVANGGDVSSVTDPQEVLERLKTKIDDDVADRQVGLSSSMVDVRVKVVPQTHEESKTDQLRAVWDSEEGRFVLSNTGDSAIKSFVLDDNLAEGESAVESREKSGFLYAGEDNWIWDFEEHPIPPMNIPTVVVTNPTLAGLPSGSDPTGPPSTPPPPGALLSPAFSIPGGKYPATNFDISVTLTNPNPAGSSTLYYALDGGALTPYTGPVPVPAGSTLVAKAVAGDSRFTDSAKVSQAYIAEKVTLSPPQIEPDRKEFGLFFGFDVNVTLRHSNPSGVALIRYRLNRGPWITYSGPFRVRRSDYPTGVTIQAQSISSGSPHYLASSVSAREIPLEALDLSGNSSGVYNNPKGSSSMVTNLPAGTSSSNFNWGDGSGTGRSQSRMQFTGDNFNDVSSGERFLLGNMNYYNGTIRSGTGADTVDLKVGLTLSVNGNSYHPYFDFRFELINTPNAGDPNNPWPDADFVRIQDSRSSRTLVINGYEYEFRLEFGDTTTDGFAQFDQFHVLEERSASVKVFGTFVNLGTVATSGSGTVALAGSELSTSTATGTTTGTDTATGPVYQKEGYEDSKQKAKQYAAEAEVNAAGAEGASSEAESAARSAVEEARLAIDKANRGEYTSAKEFARKSRGESNRSEEARVKAETSATLSKQAARNARNEATNDPSAESDAAAAIDSAHRADDANTRASQAATIANEAATRAERAAAGP